MSAQLSLSVIEIIVLMLGAITLGVTIHFIISSKKSWSSSMMQMEGNKAQTAELTEWKLRYFNDTEERDKVINELKRKLSDAEDNAGIFSIEADEMRKMNKQLKASISENKQEKDNTTKNFYAEQLRRAQHELLEHNDRITQLLNQIDIVKETEEKQNELIQANEELMERIERLELKLLSKEEELENIHRKDKITGEMNAAIGSAYSDFNTLQEKMKKLEGQVSGARRISLDFEDLKEEHYKQTRDLEELKLKWNASIAEMQDLKLNLNETEDKLREANFQRQQLQKRVAYLEDINDDMQTIADVNKQLEGQMKRIGELESMLNIVAEERDQLAKRS
jgi:chromosome segregation ATPase